MSNINFAWIYMSKFEASFIREENGSAKCAHFQDRQNRCGMILEG